MTVLNLSWFLAGCILPSLVIALASAFVIRRKALDWGLLDHPAARKVHVTPTPLGGGIALWLAVISPFAMGYGALIWWSESTGGPTWLPDFIRPHIGGLARQAPALWGLLGAGTILMIVGLIDDVRGLGWKSRLLIQFAVAIGCVLWQGWRLTLFIEIPVLTLSLSVIWIVMLVNSFNMLDNMDGLSAGVAAIAASMLAAVLLMNPDPRTHQPQLFVAGLLLVLVGALLGFLCHNRPPARIFMGDAGSYFVGFLIAVATLLATFTSYRSQAPHAVLAPLCVMAVPLYDMATVVWIRLRSGHSPFHADKNHFSHRLVDLGFTKGQAVLTIYLTTATCGLGALLLHRVDLTGAVIILLMILCVLGLIASIETTARRKLKQ